MKLSNCHALKNAFFSTLVKHHIIIETKQQNIVFYGARHLNTTCFVQDFYKFKKNSIFFSSCRNASFGHPNRSSRGIFIILKIEREIHSHRSHIGA
jgi:hypothetical protein